MRFLFLLGLLAIIPVTAHAIDAPSAQTILDSGKILRGHFVEEHSFSNGQPPLITSGHFVIAPSQGLIWGIEKPFPMLILVTPDAAVQDIAGLMVKLPAKNLRHIYEMVGGALAGNWHTLDSDFSVSKDTNAAHWQMLLTPTHTDQPKLPFTAVTISGGHFVENIVLTKPDGSYDMFTFSDTVMSPAPLAPQEAEAFSKAAGH